MDALSISRWDEEKRERIEALQWRLAQQLLVRDLTVIIEWGTWGRSERDALRVRARELNAAVELHYLAASEDALWERIQRRSAESPPIERETVSRWFEIFQPPPAEEMTLFDEPLAADVTPSPD